MASSSPGPQASGLEEVILVTPDSDDELTLQKGNERGPLVGVTVQEDGVGI